MKEENKEKDLNDILGFKDSDPSIEILPGMTVEEMKTMYFDNAALIEPAYKVWQLNSKGHRYYYRYDSSGNPEFYPSVTTILSQTIPKGQRLINWMIQTGIEESERYKEEKAHYGTFMHAIYERLIINRTYDLENLKSELKEYMEYQKLPSDFIYYADDLKKDLLAFAQFVVDYDVRPLAVEIALVHPYSKYAGMIDLPCTMLSNLRSKNRIRAIVDFKSGKKGFFEEAEIQLHFYKDMWNVNYPHLPIDRVFNFAPKDWRKRPTYNLKDQTNSPNSKKIPALLELASIEDGKKDNVFVSVSGKINLDNGLNFDENIISLSLSEIIKKKAPKPKETTPDKPAKKETLKVENPKEVLKQEPKQTKIIKRKSVTVKKTTPVAKTTKKQHRVPVVKKQAVKTVKKEVVNKSDLLDNEISI